MHRSITTLQKAGLPIHELPQTIGNTTAFSQALYDSLKGRTLRMYYAADLREQALNAVAVEAGRGWRLAKEKASRKIDAIVALAMAVHLAIAEATRSRDAVAVILPNRGAAGPDVSWQDKYFARGGAGRARGLSAAPERATPSHALLDLREENLREEAALRRFYAEQAAHARQLEKQAQQERARQREADVRADVAEFGLEAVRRIRGREAGFRLPADLDGGAEPQKESR
jgi:hypothetical protein